MDSTLSKNTKPSDEEALKDTPSLDAKVSTEELRPDEEKTEELSFETKQGFHKKLTEKDKLLKDQQRKAEELEKELSEIRERERQARLSDMTEVEKLQYERDQAVAKSYKLEIKQFVMQEINRRNLSVQDALIDMIVETPWDIPSIKRILGDSPTWEEVDREVKAKLPSYLDSLVSRNGERRSSSEKEEEETLKNSMKSEESTPVDTERSIGTTKKRVWSRREIGAMDVQTYQKYQNEINQAITEGRITP